jgi:hypothetical protein
VAPFILAFALLSATFFVPFASEWSGADQNRDAAG